MRYTKIELWSSGRVDVGVDAEIVAHIAIDIDKDTDTDTDKDKDKNKDTGIGIGIDA